MANVINDEVILGIKVKYDDALAGITEYQKRIDALREANAKLKDGNEDERKQYALNNAVIKECSYNMRVLSKEVQNNIREQHAQEGSLKQLRAQLSQLTKAYDEMSKVERNSAKGQQLRDKIKGITQELKAAEGETERFYRNVGNYENSIKNALGLNNSFANSILGLAQGGGGLQNFLGGATTAVQSFGKALLSLMANPAFLAVAGIAGSVAAFKFFFDYNQGIAEATRLTREFMGIEGDALRSVRDSIQATADVMGKDYKEVLETIDALMAQYHISAEDAIKVVNDGFVAGADLSGNMLSQIKQYAPSFHDAGIKADELVAILAQTRSGIFSEEGMQVIEMASKRIREMSTTTASSLDAIGISSKQVQADLVVGSKSTFDVIQEISARLRELPQNSQEVGNVLKDVFGRQAAGAGLQMIEQLDTMTTKIEDVKEVTGEYGRLQEEQIAAQRELNDAVSTLFDMSGHGWEEMIARAKIFGTRVLTKVIRGIVDLVNYFIDLYNESGEVRAAVQLIVGAFRTMWNVGKFVINQLIDAIKMLAKVLIGVGELMVGIFTLNWDMISSGGKRVGDAFSKGFKDGLANVDAFIKEEADIAADTIRNINKKAEKLTFAGGTASGTGGDEVATAGAGATTTSRGKTSGSGSSRTAAKEAQAAAKAEADRVKDEIAQLQKLEELWNKLITDNFERQRAQIYASYQKQIDDIKANVKDTTKHTPDAIRAMYAQIDALNRLREQDLAKMNEQELKATIEQENRRINLMLQAVRKGSEQEESLRMTQLDNEQALQRANIEATITDEQTKNEMLLALDAAYHQKRLALANEYRQKEHDELVLAIQNDFRERIMGTTSELEQLRIKLEEAQMLRDEAKRKEEESDEQWRQRQLELQQNALNAEKALADKKVEIQVAAFQAIADVTGALSDVLEEAGDKNRTLAVASKVLAIAQVAIQQGIAIANTIRAAAEGSHSVWEVAAQIAVGIASVTTSIMQALKSIKSAKFARGGYVSGAGSATSDSIPARLSNGESVINAQSTSLFAPLLSAINQLGGGVPIVSSGNQLGEDMLAAAVAKGMAYAPRPVVSVEEINRVGERVEVIERNSRIR